MVSIVIPAYNAEKWIRQCIDSALGQSYPYKEVIVIDDGSTDSTVQEIKSYGDRVLLVQSEHAGANAVRNRLTRLAQGEWLQYLDADDYLLPNKIADQIEFMRKEGWRFDVVYSPMIIRREVSRSEQPTTISQPFDPKVQFFRWSAFCTHGIMLRRSAVLEAGGWREDQPVCQEHELLLRLLTAGNKFGLWNQPGAVYRYHGSDTVSTKSPLRTIRTRMGITNQLENWLRSSNGLTAACRKEVYIARMDTARTAWQHDESYGCELATAAAKDGHFWVESNSALPLAFQAMARLCGFQVAQKFAQYCRRQTASNN